MTVLSMLAAATGVISGGPVTSDMAQLVLAQLITDSSSGIVLCIEINGADPSPSLLKKLKRMDRTIVPGSECHEWIDVNHPDYQIMTGRPAHFLRVWDAVWSSSTAVSVRAADHFDGKSAKFWTVRMVQESSGWQIVSIHLDAAL
jgi:hypothetical protein